MTERDSRNRTGRWWPVCTLAFLVSSLLADLTPRASDWLRFERAPIARGEIWRLLTGHLIHEVEQLAVLDLTALALFGVYVERVSRRLLGGVLLVSALVSSLAVFFLTDYERYVGSSALVSGLLVAAALSVLRSSRGGAGRLLALTLIALFALKIALELHGSWPAALGGLPPGYEPVAAAHLGGALGGCAAVFMSRA